MTTKKVKKQEFTLPAPLPGWRPGRLFSRRCPHCSARISLHKHVPYFNHEGAPTYKRTFACGTVQCVKLSKGVVVARWEERNETCLYAELRFWSTRYRTLRVETKHEKKGGAR